MSNVPKGAAPENIWLEALVASLPEAVLIVSSEGANRAATDKLTAMAVARGLKTDEALVDAVLELFDVVPEESSRRSLIDEATRLGLASKIGNLDATSAALRPLLRSLFSMPSFQLM